MALVDDLLETPKTSGQRRLLALDGGGIRGLITLGILEKLEADLRQARKAGPGFRLADEFDFIGGTSTGAILAAGLAIGLSVSELIAFYTACGPVMFEKEWLLKRAWNKFKSDPLKEKLQQVLGRDTVLGSVLIRTLLLVVMRNASTDSPWPVSNNPRAKYNSRSRDDCNLDLPLWQLLRASTAAPTYFPPEVVAIGQREFVFVDGGVTPYNVPAFLMYRMAVSPAYGLNWPTGEGRMLIVSIGTGSAPRPGPDATHPSRTFIEIGKSIAGELMSGMAYDQDINCRTVGRCVFGPALDREVGDLVEQELSTPGRERQFTYVRYDPDLSPEGLSGLGLGDIDSAAVVQLDSVEAIADLIRIGRTYAKQHVKAGAHLGGFWPGLEG